MLLHKAHIYIQALRWTWLLHKVFWRIQFNLTIQQLVVLGIKFWRKRIDMSVILWGWILKSSVKSVKRIHQPILRLNIVGTHAENCRRIRVMTILSAELWFTMRSGFISAPLTSNNRWLNTGEIVEPVFACSKRSYHRRSAELGRK